MCTHAEREETVVYESMNYKPSLQKQYNKIAGNIIVAYVYFFPITYH